MSFDAYLKIEGVDGESTDSNHVGWIQLQSYSHNVSNETTGKSQGGSHMGGRCQHGDISVVKPLDSSSPTLALACCQGKSHPTATLEICRSGASGTDSLTYQKVELTDVVITSVSPQAVGGSDFPSESVCLSYGTIKWTYTKTDTKGSPQGEIVTGWDLVQNKML
jgi:type VI secretion system secreted protein Hcp